MNNFELLLDRASCELSAPAVKLQWEDGRWGDLFRGNPKRLKPSLDLERRVEPPIPSINFDSEPSCTQMESHFSHTHWQSLVKAGQVEAWDEKRTSQFQVALRRWLDVLIKLPRGITLVDQLLLLTLPHRLRMLRDLFWKKAPQTLLKRCHGFLRFTKFLEQSGQAFPGNEVSLYEHLCVLRDEGVATSRIQNIMQSLNFVRFVLNVDELEPLVSSKRCMGATGKRIGGPKRQADPFLVSELKALHAELEDDSADVWNRMLAGMVLCATYSRSRWGDLQQAESIIIDRDDLGKIAFLEFKINQHKCAMSSAFRNSFLPAVAPGDGIVHDSWAETWVSVRNQLGISFEDRMPTCPAPDLDGKPTIRPLSSDEMRKWTVMILEKHGLSLEGRCIRSHSCKSTCLSWAAKFGISWEDRLAMGGHVSFLRSAIVYSRDSMSRQLRLLQEVFQQIKDHRFKPDESRSGRFSTDGSLFEAPTNSEPPPQPADVDNFVWISDEEHDLVKHESDDPDTSVASVDPDTSSSSDESGAKLSGARRPVQMPAVSPELKLMQHLKYKTLHCMEVQNFHVFICGRRAEANRYGATSEVCFDTPWCLMCWKKKAEYD